MLSRCGLSVEKYDSTLIGWHNQSPQNGKHFNMHGLYYCNGKNARDSLIARGWGFLSDKLESGCSQISVPEYGKVDPSVSLYPNPTSGYFTIQFTRESFSGKLEIYSLNGQLVYQQHIEQIKELSLNLNIAAGVYVLQLNAPNQNLTQRIVIQ